MSSMLLSWASMRPRRRKVEVDYYGGAFVTTIVDWGHCNVLFFSWFSAGSFGQRVITVICHASSSCCRPGHMGWSKANTFLHIACIFSCVGIVQAVMVKGQVWCALELGTSSLLYEQILMSIRVTLSSRNQILMVICYIFLFRYPPVSRAFQASLMPKRPSFL